MFIQIQNYLVNADDVKCIALWAATENDKRPRIVVTYKNGAYNSFEYNADSKALSEFDAIRSDLRPAPVIAQDMFARSLE